MMQQRYSELSQLSGFSFPVFASGNTEAVAQEIGERCEKAWSFLNTTLSFDAKIIVLILKPEHWQKYATFSGYGMPHYSDAYTLIVAGQNNDVWQDMVPPFDNLTSSLIDTARSIYGQPDGGFDFSSFFNLLAIHEMGHLFHHQASLAFPRLWLMELFCNLCLHAYVAAHEPEALPVLETFPQMIVAGGADHLPYHTLEDFERLYVNVGIQTYGWYQSHFLSGAKHIFDSGGTAALQRFWNAFLKLKGEITDEELALYLRNEVDPEVERVLSGWHK